nr:MAG TPA: Rubrerythrin [Caudoviricetes sp.]
MRMAEYIERSAAIKAAKHAWAKGLEPSQYIEALPAADVAPVVYGRWAHLGGDEWCCSACGFVITTEGSWDKPTKKYCEDCGAMMDGGADHEAG